MTTAKIERHKQAILERLRNAKQEGLSQSKLKISSSALKKQAFRELVETRAIANLGSQKKSRYVLNQYNQPLEIACSLIEDRLERLQSTTAIPPLISRSRLISSLPAGSIRKKGDQAIDFLSNANKLLKLRHGNGLFFLLIDVIQSRLSIPDTPIAIDDNHRPDPVLTRDHVLSAYEAVRRKTRFSSVEIYQLQKELNVPMDQLKDYIVKESEAGRAVLSFGDWSLSSEATRSGAIYIHDKPHLLVRFKTEA